MLIWHLFGCTHRARTPRVWAGGERLLARQLAWVHPRYGTPSRALLAVGLPLLAGWAAVVQRDLSISQIFALFGGFSVLSFLLV